MPRTTHHAPRTSRLTPCTSHFAPVPLASAPELGCYNDPHSVPHLAGEAQGALIEVHVSHDRGTLAFRLHRRCRGHTATLMTVAVLPLATSGVANKLRPFVGLFGPPWRRNAADGIGRAGSHRLWPMPASMTKTLEGAKTDAVSFVGPLRRMAAPPSHHVLIHESPHLPAGARIKPRMTAVAEFGDGIRLMR